MSKLFRFQRFSWVVMLFFSVFLTVVVGRVSLQPSAVPTTNPLALVLQQTGPIDLPLVNVHMYVLPNGKVQIWQGAVDNYDFY